jgi:hypothetical protein
MITTTTQKRALRNYRRRPAKQDEARFDAAGEPPKKGGIVAALRRSPLVGANLNLARSYEADRKVDS